MSRPATAGRRLIPAVLGIAMLGVVVAAALTPNSGAVPATTSCPYGNCPTTNSGSSNPLLPWELALVALLVIAVILSLVLLSRRRRGRGGTPPPSGPMEEWSGGPPGPGAPSGMDVAPAAAVAGAGAAAAPAAYLETEEDVAAPPPTMPAPAPTPPAAGGSESDIDSLMKELDKISSEILKRGTPKPEKGSAGQAAEEESNEGSGGGSA